MLQRCAKYTMCLFMCIVFAACKALAQSVMGASLICILRKIATAGSVAIFSMCSVVCTAV
jgi:hypothetical protein